MIKKGLSSFLTAVIFLVSFLADGKSTGQSQTTIFASHYKNAKDTLVICTEDPLGGSTLKLKNLTREVIRRNPDLAAARSRVKAAAAVIPYIQVWDDPEFVFRTINHPIGCKREFVKERRYKLFQKIPWPGKLGTKGKIAEHIRDSVQADKMTTHQELVLQTKRLYFQLHFNRVAVDINKQNRAIITRLMQSALAVYKVGKARQTDALKAHIELQLLDDELLSLESERESIIALLNAFLDRAQQEPLGVPAVMFFPAIELHYGQLESIAMRDRTEIHSQQARVEEQHSRRDLARLEYFPDFIFEFMIQNRPERKKRAWGARIGFNVPIWIPIKQRYQVLEAEEQAATNQAVLEGVRASIRGRIKELLAQIKASEERIALYGGGLLSKTATTLASHESQYRVGNGDFMTVLDTRRQLQNFELDYERARIEREILLAELERAVGIPLEKFPRTPPIRLKPLKLSSKKMALSKKEQSK